jgi:hypothetical protein
MTPEQQKILAEIQQEKTLRDIEQEFLRHQQVQQRTALGAPKAGSGAATYAALAQRPQYQIARPYSNPDYTPSTGTRIRNVVNTAALGWGDEAEAFARSLFSDRSYEDIQRELDWEQQQYMINRPAEAGVGMLAGGLTGGGLGGALVRKVAQVPRVVQAGQAASTAFPRVAPYAYQTGRNVVAPAATGAVMGAGVSQPGQRSEGALLGAGLNTVASLGMTALARGGGKALDVVTKNRYPETDLGTGKDAIPLSGLTARHPEAKLPEMAASITDRMLGSTAPARIRRMRQEAPERLIPPPPLEDAQAFDAVVNALRNRSSKEAKELLRQQAQQSKVQRLAPLETQSQRLTETAAARQQRIKLRKEFADRQATEQRDQTVSRVTATNQQRLIENAAPPNTDPAVIARIKTLPATEANDALLRLWKPGKSDPNASPWAFLGNQTRVVNADKLLDDAVKATGLIGEREKADVRRRLQGVLKEVNPVGDTGLSTLTSAQLMEARNVLRRKANSLTPGTPETNVAIESYRRAAKRVEDEIRAGFGGDPALNKLFDETLDRYARHRLYDDAVRKNLQKGQGTITPENVISVEARKTGQDATTGRSREVRNQFEVQNQIQAAKDAADAALTRNKASAEARTRGVNTQ